MKSHAILYQKVHELLPIKNVAEVNYRFNPASLPLLREFRISELQVLRDENILPSI